MCLDDDDLEEVIVDFLNEARDLTEQLELDLVALKDASQEEIVQRIFRNFHTIKGNANFFNAYSIFAEIAKIAHAAEDMMSKIRKGEQPVTTSWMNGVLAAFDCLKSLLEKAEQGERNVEEQTSLLNRLYSMLNSPQKELSNSDNKTVQNDSIKEQITVSQTTNVALDTPEKNDSQNTNIAVPRPLRIVPPRAPASFAASMTVSEKPALTTHMMSS